MDSAAYDRFHRIGPLAVDRWNQGLGVILLRGPFYVLAKGLYELPDAFFFDPLPEADDLDLNLAADDSPR